MKRELRLGGAVMLLAFIALFVRLQGDGLSPAWWLFGVILMAVCGVAAAVALAEGWW